MKEGRCGYTPAEARNDCPGSGAYNLDPDIVFGYPGSSLAGRLKTVRKEENKFPFFGVPNRFPFLGIPVRKPEVSRS